MTSSNENIFRVTGLLCEEFTGHRWIGEFPAQRPVTRNFEVFFDLRLNQQLSNGDAGDLRRHRAHYDVIVMKLLPENVTVIIWTYVYRALDIKVKALGWKHSDTAVSLLNFGALEQCRGHYEKALEYYEKATKILKVRV